MAKVGTVNASEYLPDGLSSAIAFAAITLSITMNASAHGGGLNSEGCHNDRKRGGYHCHRGGGASAGSDAAPINNFTSSRIAPASASHGLGVFANCARAAGAAPVRRGEPGYGPYLDRDADGDGVGREPKRK